MSGVRRRPGAFLRAAGRALRKRGRVTGRQNKLEPAAENSHSEKQMNLDEAQRQRVTAWILQGAKLSEIQTKLAAEFGLRLTYMEVRLLVDDLKLTPKDLEPPKPVAPISRPAAATKPPKPQPNGRGSAPAKISGEKASPPPGGVSVTVDQLTQPGAVVSGKVTFSDGQPADWYLDQMGRLSVAPKQRGYKPTAADVQQFQAALQDELGRIGF
jgi:ribosomal protein S16